MLESESAIFVSTIHQTKGREFDNIFLALSRFAKTSDEMKRRIYVAITRAKRSLRIFCNANDFNQINLENVKRVFDKNVYPAPLRICLHLSHKDVFLDHFTNFRREIDSLVSGQELMVRDGGCFYGKKQILRFSSKFCNKMNALKANGYIPSKAYIRHIVFWHGKNNDCEIKIILPNVEFLRETPEPY